MRINSYRGARVRHALLALCLLVFIFDIVILNIEGSWGSFYKLSPAALAILLLLLYRGQPQFKYDSDGEVLNFTTQDPLFGSRLNRFRKHLEFPKHRLSDFKIARLPLKTLLILYVKRKDGSILKQKLSISYISRPERKNLRLSLKKVVDYNLKMDNGRREELFGKQ